MGKFHQHNTMKAATLNFIGSQLISKREREDLATVFRKLDKNSDGKLSKEEIKEGYHVHYGKLISDAEIDAMFKAVDTDNNGYIEYTEFVVAAMNEKALMTQERIKGAFNMFDKDRSGMISNAEIREVLGAQQNKLPQSVIDTIIKQID